MDSHAKNARRAASGGGRNREQFAADCIRIAEKLGCEDKERLLKIADAWTERALEVERQQKKSGDRVNE